MRGENELKQVLTGTVRLQRGAACARGPVVGNSSDPGSHTPGVEQGVSGCGSQVVLSWEESYK